MATASIGARREIPKDPNAPPDPYYVATLRLQGELVFECPHEHMKRDAAMECAEQARVQLGLPGPERLTFGPDAPSFRRRKDPPLPPSPCGMVQSGFSWRSHE